MQIIKSTKAENTSLRNASGQALAQFVMADSVTAVRLLAEVSNADEIVGKLKEFPGALERIIRSDASPRWVKKMAAEALDEAGYVILT